MPHWLKWGYSGLPLPHLRAYQHPLFFARLYASHAAYPQAETVQLVRDFKISPNASKGLLEKKRHAIERFADELVMLLEKHEAWHLTWIPTSLSKDAADYDDRFEQVANRVTAKCPGIHVHEFFVRHTDTPPLHKKRGLREPDVIKAGWEFTPPERFISGVDRILVLDDVVTTGASLRAAFDMLYDKLGENTQVMGIAWAMTRAGYYPITQKSSIEDSILSAEAHMRNFEELVKSPDTKVFGQALLSWVNAYILAPAGIETINPDMPLDEAKEFLATHLLHWKESVWQAGADAGREEGFVAGGKQGYDEALRGVVKWVQQGCPLPKH